MNTTELETVVKARLDEVIEARFNMLEAMQTSNAANFIWWENALRTRQSFLRKWQSIAECSMQRVQP